MSHAAAHHADDDAIPHHDHPPYFGIFIALTVLTILEVAAAVMLPLPTEWLRFVLVILALPKAVLVALYYMHLRYEQKLIYVIALLPVAMFFLLVTIGMWDITMILGTVRNP